MRLLVLLALLVGCSDPEVDDTDAGAVPDDTADSDAPDDAPFDADGDGALPGYDCDDADPAVHPGADELCNDLDDDCDGEVDEGVLVVRWADGDGDGHGDPAGEVSGCGLPDIYASSGDDCDDQDASTYPGAPETDCTDPVDHDCDGDVAYADADGDGAAACEDCDDDDATAFPGAEEACDGVDNDCDASADEGVTRTFYGDADADGWGGDRFVTDACDAPAGYVADGSDCDDLDAAAFPGAAETCDGTDDDCDGDVDEDATDAVPWWADADADGHGDAAVSTLACDAPAGFVDGADDCDDTDATRFPDAAEACDGVDHDCDGATDEDTSTDAATWYLDADGDGYAGDAVTRTACAAPAGYFADADDCDDVDADAWPGAVEVCDGDDDDCDGSADESGATGESTWYRDADGDGFGDASAARSACDAPAGYTADATDCDDGDAGSRPGAAETCDDEDDDCDGTVDEDATDASDYFPDEDGDGFGDPDATTVAGCDAPVGYRLDGTDCDDGDVSVHPYAYESDTDGVDNDCDGAADTADTDTYRNGPTGNDSGSAVNLSGMSFPFCGSTYTSMYMQTNGRVTFGSNDTDATETTLELGSDATVAAAWDDLRTASSSDVVWVEENDAVSFHWVDVPEASGSGTNTFSIVLFEDGRILLDLVSLALTDAVVGWSCGTATVGAETDLSAGMAALPAGRWGLGDGTETARYELFNGDNDLGGTVVRLCGRPGGSSDPCAE